MTSGSRERSRGGEESHRRRHRHVQGRQSPAIGDHPGAQRPLPAPVFRKKTASSSSRSAKKAARNQQVIDTAKANPLDKFQLGIKQIIADLMIQRLGENDQIVSRYMEDAEFQNTAFPLLAQAIFESIRERSGNIVPMMRRPYNRPRYRYRYRQFRFSSDSDTDSDLVGCDSGYQGWEAEV